MLDSLGSSRLRAVGAGNCLLDLAVSNTGCAHADTLPSALHHRVDGLKVKVPTPLRNVVGVADTVAELRTAPANFTGS